MNEFKSMAISVKGLKKSFLKNLCCKMSILKWKGMVYSLLGSNGAGKTTTIRILTTLMKPDRGDLKVCGFDVIKEPENVHRVISLTGQFASVDESMTGRENLVLIGKLNHIKNPKNGRMNCWLILILWIQQNRFVSTYSGV